MEETIRSKRTLRNTNPCHPIQNIFKAKIQNKEVYQHIPSHIYTRVQKLNNLSCQQVSKLMFPIMDPPTITLRNMIQAGKAQRERIDLRLAKEKIFNVSSQVQQSLSNKKQMKSQSPRFIRSQQDFSCGEGILYNKLFRTQLENLLLN